MFLQWILLPFLFSFLTNAAKVSQHPNRVISLPGAPLHPEFPMYSGFLNASADGSSSLFYVLVEAIRVDPSTAPLVLWFNGGPGGSSLAGFFTEHGPYRVTEEGDVLTYNEFSWNQYANVLYLEGPVGVGFSINNQEEQTLDDATAAENYFLALQDFMTRVHPNYANRDFYLSGQSYAGAYVPWLSRRILRGVAAGELPNTNFKGFAIGNPVFEEITRIVGTALAGLTFGLIPQENATLIFDSWQKVLRGEEIYEKSVYEVYEMAYPLNLYFNTSIIYNIAEHCPTPGKEEKYHRVEKGSSYMCYASSTSLHVTTQSEGPKKWNGRNDKMNVAYNRTKNNYPVYKDIIDLVNENGSSFRMLIYHGDVDAILPVVLAVQSVNKIAADNSLFEQDYKPVWHFFDDFAGARTGYRSITGEVSMDMLTVRGAGHSVPTVLPAQAFQMINNFIFTKEGDAIDYSKPIIKH